MTKFKIGTLVNGGIVIGIITSELFLYMGKYPKDYIHPWDNIYPEWKNKFVYYVLFDEYKNAWTEEEFYEQTPELSKIIKDECRHEYYEKYVTKARCLTMPEDALTLDV